MTSTEIGMLVLDVLAGVGALLVGLGVLIGMLALAKTLAARQRDARRRRPATRDLGGPSQRRWGTSTGSPTPQIRRWRV